jgi:hypothetical protein
MKLAKQQVFHIDMIKNMNILDQQFSLPSLPKYQSSTNPTLEVLRAIPCQVISVDPLTIISSVSARTKLDLS